MATKKPASAGGMRVVIERAVLLRALTATTKAVESRTTYPILSNVLLTAEPACLTVRGTDLDIEITTRVPAECSPGSTTVAAKMLLDIVRKFPDGSEVVLEQGDETLVVKAGRSRFQLPTLPVDSFPDLKAGGDFCTPFTTDIAGLAGQVAFAISTEETRYYLNGIYLHTVNGRLRVVATDGHRMARADGDEIAATLKGVIVPRKTAALLPVGSVQVEVSETKIRLTAGDTVIVSKLIEGTFPDYDRVTPKNNDKAAEVDRSALLAAIDRVSIVASERGGRAVKLTVADSAVTLSVNNPDHGEASEDVPADTDLDGFVIGANANYLSDILRAVGGSTAKFAWADAGAPMLVSGDNDNWLGVLMPLRVA